MKCASSIFRRESDSRVNCFSWLVRKHPPCVVHVLRTPSEKPCFLNISRNARRTQACFPKNIKKLTLKNALFMGTVSVERGTPVGTCHRPSPQELLGSLFWAHKSLAQCTEDRIFESESPVTSLTVLYMNTRGGPNLSPWHLADCLGARCGQ